MSQQDLFVELSSGCQAGMRDFSSAYLRRLQEIFRLATDSTRLRSRVSFPIKVASRDLISFSATFNDLTFIEPTGSSELVVSMLAPEGFKKLLGVDQVLAQMPVERATELGLEEKQTVQLAPAFIFQGGSEVDSLLREIAPLISTGRVIPQPTRALFSRVEEKNEVGSYTWKAYPVDAHSPFGAWRITDEAEASSRPIPISYSPSEGAASEAMFQVTLPYLRGISFKDLAGLIEDEQDLLIQLRSSLKSAVAEAKPGQDFNEFARDTIDPEIAKLNRKLKSIENVHAFRIAGVSVGTVALALTAVSTAGISGALAAISGAGGLGVMTKQYADYRKERSVAEDDPHYFLWRCKQLNK